jgi:hypothetical protein
MLQWMRRLLRREHLCPHRDGVGPGSVEGGPRQGIAAPVARAARAIVLAFPLPLVLTLTFAVIVGGRARGGGPPEDIAVPTEVGAEAAVATKDALLLRAWSRT